MNILLINHYAGSNKHGMEYRPYYLSREWVKMGHQVTILASSQSHVRTIQPEMNGKWTEEIIDGIRYIWIDTPSYEGNGVKRVINIFSFVKELMLNSNKIVSLVKPDVVIGSSTYPLDMYPAHKTAKKAKAKLVFEVHDLWPLTPKLLGNMSSLHPFIFLMQRGENFAYKKADKVVSLLPNAKQHMFDHGMDLHKFAFLPNGIVVDEWNSATEKIPAEHQKVIHELKSKDKFLVGYAGGHGISNAMEYVIETAELLKEEPIEFVLVGKGPEKEKLIEEAKKKGLANVHFLPVIDKNAIPDFLSRMDCLFIGWRKSPLYQFGVSPNKLLDYMMSGKPIVHSIEAGNDLVKEANCGISVLPEDPRLIADAIKEMYKKTDAERQLLGKNGKDFVMKNHDYKVLADKFLHLLN
ncbi:glycosyltransferase family 4 protein [Bacillus sp. JJ1521]|uniref:glycosyltransferase family 4 protein n=1 Tax=Bacillus sp. JJ1521 TaxID=3122957 RepID=UPI002FFF87BA